jgi:hypothetical protein
MSASRVLDQIQRGIVRGRVISIPAVAEAADVLGRKPSGYAAKHGIVVREVQPIPLSRVTVFAFGYSGVAWWCDGDAIPIFCVRCP